MRKMAVLILMICSFFSYYITYEKLKPWIIAACAGTLSGCGSFAVQMQTSYPIELAPFIEDYRALRGEFLLDSSFSKPLIISFKELEGNTIGVCTNYGFKGTIQLDTSWWSQHDYNDQLELLMHEMGHCDLGYGHIPGGIMDEYHLSVLKRKDRERYISEFFNVNNMLSNSVYEKGTH